MKRLTWVALLATATAAVARDWSDSGPIRLLNSHPFHSIFLDQPLLDPQLPPRMRLEFRLSAANTMAIAPLVKTTPAGLALAANIAAKQPQSLLDVASLRHTAAGNPKQGYFFADTETSRLDLDLTVPIDARWGFEVEVPVMGHHGGVFDNVIKAFHRAAGFPDLDRSYAPTGQTQLFAAEGNRAVFYGGSSEPSLGDITARGLYAPLRETADQPALLLNYSVKLPTGAASRFMGSGSVDHGWGVSVAKGFGNWRLYLGGGYTYHGKWKGLPTVPIGSTVDFHAAAEYRFTSRWSFQAMFSRQESALDKADPGTFGFAAPRIGTAVRYRCDKDLAWELGFFENLDEHQNTEDATLQYRVLWMGF